VADQVVESARSMVHASQLMHTPGIHNERSRLKHFKTNQWLWILPAHCRSQRPVIFSDDPGRTGSIITTSKITKKDMIWKIKWCRSWISPQFQLTPNI
jgi:hypothetical protein